VIDACIYRPARLEDVALLPDIERSAASLFGAVPALQHLADGDVLSGEDHTGFLANDCLWVVGNGGTIVGFLAAEVLDGNLHIRELSVHSKAQGRGYGRSLLDLGISAARRRGHSAVTLTTFREVPWNAPFYSRYGFRILEGAQVSPALAAILSEELAHGMPPGSRCAMILPLG
jgi:ribosomal protein S18 acetylase RimI-like enzyme